MPATKKPKSATLRVYNVGFGDCSLLTFHYGQDDDRHLLVDFGSLKGPGEGYSKRLKMVAADIKEVCGDKLHAVVASHRHRDHIQGFTTKASGDGPGDVIRALEPEVVIQPWTEEPEAAVDYQGPAGLVAARRDGRPGAAARKKAHRQSLDDMQQFAAKVAEMAGRSRGRFREGLRQRMAFVGEDAVKNKNPIRNLIAMADGEVNGKPKGRYVHCGYKLDLADQFPGVRFEVLGPPTLTQHDAILKETRESDEFWMLAGFWAMQRKAVDARRDGKAGPLFAAKYRHRGRLPAEVRPFVEVVREVEAEEMEAIVTAVDDALNNTSVILLIEACDRKLLFPGDAQIENWEYALDNKKLFKKLSDVSIFHVGHHGSRNATPRKLWNNFVHCTPEGAYEMLALLSTVTPNTWSADKYKQTSTEIPRQTLLEELGEKAELDSTDGWDRSKLVEVYEIPGD